MMLLDKNTVLTTTFTIVDDVMKAPKIAKLLKRPGPAPRLTDSEVVTLSLYQELIGEPREDHFFRLHGPELKKYFPNLNERSRYNRRRRDLWSVTLAVRLSLIIMLKAWEQEQEQDLGFSDKTALIDSAPVPCISYKRDKEHHSFPDAGYGVCSSKAMKYFGFKFHSLVTLCGVILDFLLTSATPHDSQIVEEFLAQYQEVLKEVLGDKGYNSQYLKETLLQELGILLWSPPKRNQKHKEPREVIKANNTLRLIVETVNAQLQEQLHLSKHYAKSQWGLFTRTAAKVTAHTIGILINLIYDRPPLALASLAV